MDTKKSNKKNIAVFVGLIVLILGLLLIQYYGYSSVNISEKEYVDIQRKYHLVLQDENWERQLYNKNTIINSKPSFYCFKNYYVTLFDDKFTTVSIKVTGGDEIFDLALPTYINGRFEPRIMIEENVNHNNLNIQIQMIKTREFPELAYGYYAPNCKFIFEYNGDLYHIEFLNMNNPNLVYSEQDKQIHLKELEVYLSWLDSVLI